MFTADKRRMLRAEHKKKEMVDCLVEEVFALRFRLGKVQDNLTDVNNRLRYVEFVYKKAEKT